MKRSAGRYFTCALSIFVTLSIPTTASTASITIQDAGSKGIDGYDGHHGGGNASPSSPGTSGGRIDIEIKDVESQANRQRGRVQILGTTSRQNVNEIVDVQSQIHLDVSGGKGGDGGNGGPGTAGCNGHNGSDASRYSSGTNGTDGCNGGPGGNATPGSNGGDAGDISVKLGVEDVHLSLLVSANISGGPGGLASQNGSGGTGGRGGRGGSSYSWTETYQDGQSCSDHQSCSLESNGDGSYSNNCSSYQTCSPTYRTDYHSNPGGYDGRDGSDGPPGHGDTSPGGGGRDGSFRFLVKYPNGQEVEYKRPFDLKVKSYKFIDEDKNGIFEPGERVRVYDIVVTNAAEMPSPYGKAKALISISNSQYFFADPLEIEVPELKGGESVTLKQDAWFTIKSLSIAPSRDRIAVQDSIVPIGRITRVERSVKGFELPQTFLITYPIELTTMTSKSTLGPGEEVDVIIGIRNISQIPLGALAEVQRQISVQLSEIAGQVSENHYSFTFIDNQNRMKLETLMPNEIRILEGKLKLSSDAPVYSKITLKSGLFYQPLKQTDQKEIQNLAIDLRIAQTYRHQPGAEVLIITNAQTERPEIVNWRKLLEDQLGLKVDVWDMSYNGFLSLTRDLDQNRDSSIMSRYKGKLVIMLNSDLGARRPIDELAVSDFRSAMQANGISVFVVGGSDVELEQQFSDLAVRQLNKASGDFTLNELEQNLKSETFELPDRLTIDEIKTSKRRIQAKRVLELIRSLRPNDSYLVFGESENGSRKKTTTLFLERTSDIRHGVVVGIPLSDPELKSGRYLESTLFLKLLCQALPLETRVQILANTPLSSDLTENLSKSILVNLIEELEIVRRSKTNKVVRPFSERLASLNMKLPRSRAEELTAPLIAYAEISDTEISRNSADEIIGHLARLSQQNADTLIKASREQADQLIKTNRARSKALIGQLSLASFVRSYLLASEYGAIHALTRLRKLNAEFESPKAILLDRPLAHNRGLRK